MKNKQTKRLHRKYNIKDIHFRFKADSIISKFKEDIDAIKDIDPSLNENYLTFAEEQIKNIKEKGLDEIVVCETKLKTTNINSMMAEARRLYGTAKFYFTKAFPGQPAIWNEFGASDYGKVRASQLLMMPFLTQLILTIKKYREVMLQAGMKATLITDLEVINQNLSGESTLQEQGKKIRLSDTQHRVAALNALYDTIAPICRAAKLAFAEDEAHRKIYILYHGRKVKRKSENKPKAEE
ncbi:MAG: hypothetical protein M0R21_07565 [Lentimicrobiaceae bacterium]|jgi:hypothetical protein|nr:hypothetical protein [Lentimicrobiaceae bacterium]